MYELRYVLKLLGKNIRFSLLCTSVIAIGVGILLPLYVLVNNIDAKDLLLERGDRYIALEKQFVDKSFGQRLSRYDNFHYQYFKNNATSFASLQAWRELPVSVSDGEHSEVYRGVELEPALLQDTGIQPFMGRAFIQEDASFDAEPVAILSYDSWLSYYAGRQDIVGHQSRVNGEAITIIGVMPKDFAFPVSHEMWLPLFLSNDILLGQGEENLAIVGILADKVSMTEASLEIQLLQAQVKSRWQDEYDYIDTSVVQPYSSIAGLRAAGASVLYTVILLLVTLNAGNLFVVRGEERIQELAIRSAMGASHQKIAQALMLESFMICFIGLLLGIGLAQINLNYIDRQFQYFASGFSDTFWWDMSLNSETILVSSIVTVVVWVFSGGLAAWRISRSSINDLISTGGSGQGGNGASRISKFLVNAQLIVNCVLMTVGISSIVITSDSIITRLQNSELLYTGESNSSNELEENARELQRYRTNLLQSLSAQPAISDVLFTSVIPGQGGASQSYDLEESLVSNDIYPQLHVLSVSDNYFDMLGMEILEGRGFGPTETVSSLSVAIIDHRLANSLWPDSQAIGKRIQIDPSTNPEWITVIGVSSAQIQEPTLPKGREGIPVLYRAILQTNPGRFFTVFKSNDPSVDFRNALRLAATQANRDIPMTNISSMSSYLENQVANQQFNFRINYTFLLVAMYLTAISTYGLAARAASRRQIEIGIRMALGAGRSSCLRTILKDGFIMVLTGLSLGGGLAILISYLIITSSSLPAQNFSLEPLLLSTGLVAVLLGVLVMLANYFPARKIISMEPGDALHHE